MAAFSRLLPALVLLTACSEDVLQTTPIYAPQTAAVTEERISSRYRSVEVVEVTLPTYAEDEAIYVRDGEGALSALGPFWADAPARSVTMQLARELGAITGARVAPEPWPFRTFADVRVDVRVEDFVATSSGAFLIAGQYFVAPDSGERERAGRFEITAPLANASSAGIAMARSNAVAQLAVEVAREGLR